MEIPGDDLPVSSLVPGESPSGTHLHSRVFRATQERCGCKPSLTEETQTEELEMLTHDAVQLWKLSSAEVHQTLGICSSQGKH